MSDMLQLVVEIRNRKLERTRHQMSDILQLVVGVGKTQARILPVTSHIESPDKLKHVGHLVARFFKPSGLRKLTTSLCA